jgi:mismatch-specific thymine-DNA glycosylase
MVMAVLTDLLTPGLQVVLVGYNPGRFSMERGHHFAGPGNYLWPLLFEAGLTGRRLTWEEDSELLFWGIGLTNLVERMTPGSADLEPDELQAGGRILREKIARFRPRVVCLLGKDIYRWYRGASVREEVRWGLQSHSVVPGVRDYVAPNPSRRSTIPYGVRLRYMMELKGLLTHALEPGPAAGSDPGKLGEGGEG